MPSDKINNYYYSFILPQKNKVGCLLIHPKLTFLNWGGGHCELDPCGLSVPKK